MKFDRDQTFTEQMLYDTTFLLFSAMLYDVVLVWPPHATLLYSVVLARGQLEAIFSPHSFVVQAVEIFFANFVSSVLEIFLYNLAAFFTVFCSFTSFTIF